MSAIPAQASVRAGSHGEQVLQAACSLGRPFTPEDLVVRAFQLHPRAFALKGYPELPDSNRVLSCLYGGRGLVAKGRIRRLDGGKYQARG